MLKHIFCFNSISRYFSIFLLTILLTGLLLETVQADDKRVEEKQLKSSSGIKIDPKKSADPFAELPHINLLSDKQLNLGAINILDNKIIKLKYNKDKTLVLDKGDSQTTLGKVRTDEKKGIWINKNKKWIQALWWEKGKKEKILRIKVSRDQGKTFTKDVAFIAKKGVLPELSMADDGEDRFAAVYTSERRPGYQLYFNRSLDGGRTWLDDDVRINDLYTSEGKVINIDAPLKDQSKIGSHVSVPFVTFINNTLLIVWQETYFEKGAYSLRIVSKQSKDFGDTWEENEIFSVPGLNPQSMSVSQAGDEVFISVWIPAKGLHTFVAKNNFSVWESQGVIPDTKDFIFTDQMKAVYIEGDKQPKRAIAFTGRDQSGIEKPYFFIQNDLSKKEWIDISAQITGKTIAKVISSTDFNYKSNNAVIETLGENAVFVAWEDHSFHVPTTLYNYSLDGGDSWLKTPRFINRPGKNFQRYPHFITDKNSLWLVFSQYGFSVADADTPSMYTSEVARLINGNEVSVMLPAESLEKNISTKEKLALLKKRANELWDFRVKRKYAETYMYFDPIYRSSFSRQNFASSQGKIQFKDYELGDIELSEDGLSAIMDTSLTVSLIMFVSMEPDSKTKDPTPPKKYVMKAKWGWYYDNWYLMPETLFDRRRQF